MPHAARHEGDPLEMVFFEVNTETPEGGMKRCYTNIAGKSITINEPEFWEWMSGQNIVATHASGYNTGASGKWGSVRLRYDSYTIEEPFDDTALALFLLRFK